MSQTDLLIFACTSIKQSPCGSHASTTSRHGYVQTANEGYLRMFGCFRVFSVPFATALPAFLERGVCLVMKY